MVVGAERGKMRICRGDVCPMLLGDFFALYSIPFKVCDQNHRGEIKGIHPARNLPQKEGD